MHQAVRLPCAKVIVSLKHRIHFGWEFQPAVFGLFTHVCKDINTLVFLYINSNTAEAGARSPAILKKENKP